MLNEKSLSVIIPARNEEFLKKTIDSVLSKSMGPDTEVIAILDGYWPEAPGLPVNPKVTVVHHDKSIGQRAAVNEGARISKAKYIMKLDAHCQLDKGFDVKLMENCEYDWTVLPRMYTLHAFDWKCLKCGDRTYQGEKPKKCEQCGHKDFERVIVWRRNTRKRTDYMWIDQDLRMKYFDGKCLRPYGPSREVSKMCHHKYKEWAKGNITDVMVGVGCCWFLHRDRFFELGGMDEEHGSWGQMGAEVAMKAWLSGGRQVINKNTWFAHLFRTQAGFKFPYPISGKDQRKAREYSNKLWKGNKWSGQTRDIDWFINKFAPLPGWHVNLKDAEKEVEPLVKAESQKLVTSGSASTESQPSKGIIYYTDNRCEERISLAVRNQLRKCCLGMEIVSISHLPIDMGRNLVVNWERSVLTMFKQILAGLELSTASIVFLTEHDVLYNQSHFEFTPPRQDTYYYNENNWALDAKTGQALFYRPRQQVSGLCGYRHLLLEHYRARVARVEKEGFSRKMGYEPGKKPPKGIDNHPKKGFFSEFPNVDIKHGNNVTKGRFKLEQYRCRERIKDSWVLADEIPYWGKTKGSFDRFILEVGEKC